MTHLKVCHINYRIMHQGNTHCSTFVGLTTTCILSMMLKASASVLHMNTISTLAPLRLLKYSRPSSLPFLGRPHSLVATCTYFWVALYQFCYALIFFLLHQFHISTSYHTMSFLMYLMYFVERQKLSYWRQITCQSCCRWTPCRPPPRYVVFSSPYLPRRYGQASVVRHYNHHSSTVFHAKIM